MKENVNMFNIESIALGLHVLSKYCTNKHVYNLTT